MGIIVEYGKHLFGRIPLAYTKGGQFWCDGERYDEINIRCVNGAEITNVIFILARLGIYRPSLGDWDSYRKRLQKLLVDDFKADGEIYIMVSGRKDMIFYKTRYMLDGNGVYFVMNAQDFIEYNKTVD